MGIEESINEILGRVRRIEKRLDDLHYQVYAVGVVVTAYGMEATGMYPVIHTLTGPTPWCESDFVHHGFYPFPDEPRMFRWEPVMPGGSVDSLTPPPPPPSGDRRPVA